MPPTDRDEPAGSDDSTEAMLAAITDSTRDLAARLQDARRDPRAAWQDVATAGWMALLVGEARGGLGLTLRHLARLHEELGRNPVPLPVIGCGLLPAILLDELPGSTYRDALAARLQRGELLAGLAWQDAVGQLAPGATSRVAVRLGPAGATTLEGAKRWIVATRDVDGWMVDATGEDGVRHLFWVPAESPGVRVQPRDCIGDEFVCDLAFDGVTAGQLLASGAAVARALNRAIDTARIAQAAELVGVAKAAFALTIDYLKTRVQFDRPIGANQALQHRMVDAYVRLEMADAGLESAVQGHLRGERSLPQVASWAKARSADLGLMMTRLAVQMHGAMGLTDEYALGRYWKRAHFLAGWLGNGERHALRHLELHRAQVAFQEAGEEASPERAEGPATSTADGFRRMVRRFLQDHYPPELRNPHRRLRLHEVKSWYETLSRRGWIAPAWPREHGGMGLAPDQLLAFVEEFEHFGAARLPDQGIINVGPILMRFGTEEQRERHLPKILSGEEIWCQGYSEPNAGSDLASLRTRAELRGDHFVVNGQKIWTTLAHDATHMFMLARTSNEARKHDGISFLLLDLSTPGVTVRPIRNIAGEEEFCEVFLDEVAVPVANLVGKMGDGWKIGMALLGFERLFVGSPKTSQHALAQLGRIGSARGLWSDPAFCATYARLLLEVLELKASFAQFASLVGRGKDLPPNVSILKVWATETYARISAELVRFADEDGTRVTSVAMEGGEPVAPLASLLNASMTTIYAGSNEIQKNILAKRVLGLPV